MAIMSSVQQANLRDLAAVRAFFASMSHADVFRYCLNLNRERYSTAPALAKSTIVVCLDTEGWDASTIVLKELGISTFDARDMEKLDTPGPWGENLLKQVFFYFARIQKNAHLKNRNYSAGDPDTNRFGQMRFLDDHEIQACLQELFEWRLGDKDDDCVCPVVLLGHALDNDVEKMQKLLHFDPLVKGNLVKQIDTQKIARDVGHWDHPVNQIGLQRLVNDMGFDYRDSHTACNDSAMTIIAAMQLVLDDAFKGSSQPKSLQGIINEVERRSQGHDWRHGSPLFCFRCGSRSHTKENSGRGRPCRARVYCVHCEKARPGSQFGHRSVSCVMKAFESSNSSRPNPNKHRGRGATIAEAGESSRRAGEASRQAGISSRQASESSQAGILAVSESTRYANPTPVPTNSWAAIAARTPADGVTSSTVPNSRFTTLRTNKGKAPIRK